MTSTDFGERPFSSEKEQQGSGFAVHIHVASPKVHAHVVPAAGKTAPLTPGDFLTSFLVSWQPAPVPPAHWVELLKGSPFGTQTIRARDLRWDGRHLSIELLNESDIEAFAIEMADWVAYANAEFGREEHTPAVRALEEAQKRATELENRLRR
jgi:hypothetical protein